MAKITSKLQVTVPKVIAVKYGIQPGDDVEFQAAGESIRLVLKGYSLSSPLTLQQRLQLFDEATARQQARQNSPAKVDSAGARGWSREELYDRGEPG